MSQAMTRIRCSAGAVTPRFALATTDQKSCLPRNSSNCFSTSISLRAVPRSATVPQTPRLRSSSLVAPVFAYGYKTQPHSGGGNHRVGTTSLGATTLIALVEDVVSSFLEQGFKNVVVLNGHYENYQFIYGDSITPFSRRATSAQRAVSC